MRQDGMIKIQGRAERMIQDRIRKARMSQKQILNRQDGGRNDRQGMIT
jgi:hypothetical protein